MRLGLLFTLLGAALRWPVMILAGWACLAVHMFRRTRGKELQ